MPLVGRRKPARQTNVIQGEAPFKLLRANMGSGLEKSILMSAGLLLKELIFTFATCIAACQQRGKILKERRQAWAGNLQVTALTLT